MFLIREPASPIRITTKYNGMHGPLVVGYLSIQFRPNLFITFRVILQTDRVRVRGEYKTSVQLRR